MIRQGFWPEKSNLVTQSSLGEKLLVGARRRVEASTAVKHGCHSDLH